MRRRIHSFDTSGAGAPRMSVVEVDTCMSYEEEDTYLVHLARLVMVLPTRTRGELSELPKPRPLTVTVVAP